MNAHHQPRNTNSGATAPLTAINPKSARPNTHNAEVQGPEKGTFPLLYLPERPEDGISFSPIPGAQAYANGARINPSETLTEGAGAEVFVFENADQVDGFLFALDRLLDESDSMSYTWIKEESAYAVAIRRGTETDLVWHQLGAATEDLGGDSDS